MSGKPYSEGVANIVAALSRCDELRALESELAPLAAKLQTVREEYHRLSNEIARALNTMDLERQDNAGFGGRMGWFLAEMRRQMKQALTPSGKDGEK